MGNGLRKSCCPSGRLKTSQKIVAICQPNFLPWLGYIEMGHRADVYVMLDDVQFPKQEWVNRNRIPDSSDRGWKWLSIPIKKSSHQVKINQVEISYDKPWQSRIIRSIDQIYRQSPCFQDYRDELTEILESHWIYLVELNLTLIKWIYNKLGMSDNLILSSDLNVELERDDKLVEICARLDATTFLANNGSKGFIDPSNFHSRNVSFVFQNYTHPTYDVANREFTPYLSIIDLIFHEGTNTLNTVLKGRNPDWESDIIYET